MLARDPDLPVISKCIKGRVYKLSCRNLHYGVFDGEEGFIGIRTKWGEQFLFTEFHWDQGAPHGTVRHAIDLGIDLPKDIEPSTHLGTIDDITKKPVERIEDGRAWRFIGEKERDIAIQAMAVPNPGLSGFLEEVARDHSEREDTVKVKVKPRD